MKKPGKTPEPPRTLGEDDKAGIRAALRLIDLALPLMEATFLSVPL